MCTLTHTYTKHVLGNRWLDRNMMFYFYTFILDTGQLISLVVIGYR